MASSSKNIEWVKGKFSGSDEVVKNGTSRGVQRWLCRNCDRAFIDNEACKPQTCFRLVCVVSQYPL